MRNIFLPTERAPNVGAVYAIINTHQSRVYVGSTGNMYRRKLDHLSALRTKNHSSKKLEADWHSDINNFIFVILEVEKDKTKRLDREQWYLDTLQPYYNSFINSRGCLGYKYSDESKERLRVSHTGLKPTDKTRKLLSEATKGSKNPFFGKTHTEVNKLKMAEGHRRQYELGKVHYNANKLRAYTADGAMYGEWISTSRAEVALGIKKDRLGKALRKGIKFYLNLHWEKV